MIGSVLRNRHVKMGMQKVIGSLPGGLAFSLNEASVRLVRGSVQQRIDTVERSDKCLSNLKTLRNDVNFDMQGARVLELGTGWHGVDIILFHLLGAEQITTVDHWPHLSLESIRVQIETIDAKRGLLDFEVLGRKEEIYDRLDTLARAATDSNVLSELLNSMDVSYEIVKRCDVTNVNLPNESIDLFYTESVLQRIPERTLTRILSHVGHNLLSPNGVVFARTDQSDINTQEHVDRNAWGLEYLKHSDWFWNLLCSEKLNYQNRLRESDFIKLFERGAIHVLKPHSVAREEDVKRLQGLRLARRFRNHDLHDVAIKHSTILGRKDPAAPCAESVGS